jgi:HD-GYP domain-containing protein (c-di-GMP phosphodiesterase class II)
VSPDPIREPLVVLGRALIDALSTIMSHPEGAEKKSTEQLRERVAHGMRIAPRLELRVGSDAASINDQEISFGPRASERLSTLHRALARRGFGGIAFDRAVGFDMLKSYVNRCLLSPATEDRDRAALRAALAELARAGIRTLGAKPTVARSTGDPTRRAFALAAYVRALEVFERIAQALRTGGRLPAADEWRSALEDLVAVASVRPNHLMRVQLGARNQRRALEAKGQGYAGLHAANTAVYAIGVGLVIGFDRRTLVDLAASAFFADLGFALLPATMLDRDVELADEERMELRSASLRSFCSVLSRSQLSEAFLRRLTVGIEHHGVVQTEGEPPRPAHLFSRIVAVTDSFDALVNERSWRPAYAFREALETLEQQPKYDPLVVRVLAAYVAAVAELGVPISKVFRA